jgi:ACS family glucarate transporter-like MFS transporter
MPAYLTMNRGFSTLGMGRILSTPLFAMAVVNIAGGWCADRLIARSGSVFAVRIRFVGAGLLGASAILLLNFLPGRTPVLAILFVSICSFGVASSSFWSIAQHTPPSPMVGRSIGYLNSVGQLAGIAAPLITGWTLGPQKNFGFAIMVAGASPLMACLLLLTAGTSGLTGIKKVLSTMSHDVEPA